jgi:hypothetical protein
LNSTAAAAADLNSTAAVAADLSSTAVAMADLSSTTAGSSSISASGETTLPSSGVFGKTSQGILTDECSSNKIKILKEN